MGIRKKEEGPKEIVFESIIFNGEEIILHSYEVSLFYKNRKTYSSNQKLTKNKYEALSRTLAI